jgi:cysteine desulfurase
VKPVYLDNNATTRVDPAVVDAMLPFFTAQFGNPSSTHAFGSEVGMALKAARQQLQALLGCQFDHEIVYTSGGTESDNAAILSALQTQEGRDEIIVSAVEHPAILNLTGYLEQTGRAKVHVIGVDEKGRLDMAAYRAALGPKTAIVSVMWANNETGTIFPVEALAALAHEAGALFHTDAVQAVGKIPMKLAESQIDMLSLSGHKLHGPKGIGALFIRKGVKFRPLIRGGNQERGRRGGTENAPSIIGLGKAAELALAHMQDEVTRVAQLRGRLEKGLMQRIGHVFVIGDTDNRLPNTANIGFDYAEGEAVLSHMNREGIAASLGSACSSGSMELSHVLRAMNVPYTVAQGAIRFSFSRENGEGDVDRVLEVVPPIVEKLRGMSPQWREREAASAPLSQKTA